MAPDSLDRYREMRDFERTPEPAGAPAPEPAEQARFVIQMHSATALHWDVRLERDGALASWAVPKGVPPHPGRNHLAVQTEDHPLEYLTFHGEIPEGNYGAGWMKVFDTGTYETHKWSDREVMVTFHGERTSGRHVFFKTGGRKGRDWMLHRMDQPDDPTRELLPEPVRPMSATDSPEGAIPTDEESWTLEVDWGGTPVTCAVEGGRVTLTGADGSDASDLVPAKRRRAAGEHVGVLQVVLHGEVVGDLVVISDLVWLDGHWAAPLPWRDRARLLEALEPVTTNPHWQLQRTYPATAEDAAALVEAASTTGAAGIVAKRLDGPYTPGETSDAWVRHGADTFASAS